MRRNVYTNVLLYGAQSDLGIALINKIPLAANPKLILIGRSEKFDSTKFSRFNEVLYHQHDLQDMQSHQELSKFLENTYDLDLVIMASATLPLEGQDLNFESVQTTIATNTLGACVVLSIMAKKLLQETEGHLVYISSVAAIRPRLRNFTYGASKAGADFFARGLSYKYRNDGLGVTVVRPGFVHTKMSKEFIPAPFAISTEDFTEIALTAIKKRRQIAYAPRKLKVIMNLVRFIPRAIFDRLN